MRSRNRLVTMVVLDFRREEAEGLQRLAPNLLLLLLLLLIRMLWLILGKTKHLGRHSVRRGRREDLALDSHTLLPKVSGVVSEEDLTLISMRVTQLHRLLEGLVRVLVVAAVVEVVEEEVGDSEDLVAEWTKRRPQPRDLEVRRV